MMEHKMKIYINSSYQLFYIVSIFIWVLYFILFRVLIYASGISGIVVLFLVILHCLPLPLLDNYIRYVFLRKYIFYKNNKNEIAILRKNSEIPIKLYNIKKIKRVLLEITDGQVRFGIDSKEHGQDTYIIAIKIYYAKFFHKKALTKIKQDMQDIFGDKLEITS